MVEVTQGKVHKFTKGEEAVIEQLRKMPRRNLIVGKENPSPFEVIHAHWDYMSPRFRKEFGVLLTEAVIEAQEFKAPEKPITVDDIIRVDALYSNDSRQKRRFFLRLEQSLSDREQDSTFDIGYGYVGSVILTDEEIESLEKNKVLYSRAQHLLTFDLPAKVVHIDGQVPEHIGLAYAKNADVVSLPLEEVKKLQANFKENVGMVMDLIFINN